MQEPTSSTTTSAQARPTLRPLSNGRTLEKQVEEQIRLLLRCAPADLWQRAQQSRQDAPDYVAPEALVYLLRHKQRHGDGDAAWKLAEILLDRSARFLYQQVACWKLFSPQHAEDCIRDIQTRMLEDLFDDSSATEFWAVRFWLCLKRRAINIAMKYRAIASAEFTPDEYDDGEGHATDFFALQAAPETIPPELLVQIREGLALLTPDEQTAFVLFHCERWPQEAIAQRLGKTDRTVRNLLTRAEKRLAAWRNDNL